MNRTELVIFALAQLEHKRKSWIDWHREEKRKGIKLPEKNWDRSK